MAGYGDHDETKERPSKRALELFRWIREREADFAENGDGWPTDQRSAYLDAQHELDAELGRKPWDESIWHSASVAAPAWMRRQGPAAVASYAEAHEVRMTLERLSSVKR